MHADLCASVLEVVCDEQVSDQSDCSQCFVALLDQYAVVFGFGFPDIDGDQSTSRRQSVGLEEEDGSVVSDERVFVIEGRHQVDGHAVGFGEVLVEDSVLVVGPFPNGQDQVASVLGDVGIKAPVGVVGPFVDQHIVGLGRADAVVVDFLIQVDALELVAFAGFVKPAVEEASTVVGPRDAAELDPLELVVELASRVDVHHSPGLPVRTRLGHSIGHVPTVVAEGGTGQCDGSVLGPGVGVDQDPGLAVEGVEAVKYRLVLQSVVLVEEVSPSLFERGSDLLVVPQSLDPPPDRITFGQSCEVPECGLVLSIDPVGNVLGLADIVFEPAIGIGNLGAVVGVDMVDPPRLDIFDVGGVERVGHGQQSGKQEHGNQRARGEAVHRESPVGGPDGRASGRPVGEMVFNRTGCRLERER